MVGRTRYKLRYFATNLCIILVLSLNLIFDTLFFLSIIQFTSYIVHNEPSSQCYKISIYLYFKISQKALPFNSFNETSNWLLRGLIFKVG